MAIRVYLENEHPSGFIGIRVTRSFAGQYKQAYFSFREKGGFVSESQKADLMAEAEALEAQWKKESEAYRYQSRLSVAHPNTKPCRSVGVEGITAEFAVDNSGQSRSYYYPGFRVSQPGPGSRAATHIRFSQMGFDAAWKAAVELWAERYSILPKDKRRVIRNMPAPEQFIALRKQMNKEGHSIPLEALDPVFGKTRASKTEKPAKASSVAKPVRAAAAKTASGRTAKKTASAASVAAKPAGRKPRG